MTYYTVERVNIGVYKYYFIYNPSSLAFRLTNFDEFGIDKASTRGKYRCGDFIINRSTRCLVKNRLTGEIGDWDEIKDDLKSVCNPD